MKNKAKETKTFPGYIVKADEDSGIVDAYVSIMGIIDDDNPPDLIEQGAFVKTIQERGPAGINRIRVLWQHSWSEVIGMPLVITEHGRDQLPADVLERYPEATGGLFTRTQFVLEVQQAREAFALYKAGAMSEWSIGFDTLKFEWDKEGEEENEREFRRLQEIRLWEYSPVTWGANPGTVTTDVKDAQDEDVVDDRDEDVPLIEPEDDLLHLEEGAEPPTALTPVEAVQSKQVGLVPLVSESVRETVLKLRDSIRRYRNVGKNK